MPTPIIEIEQHRDQIIELLQQGQTQNEILDVLRNTYNLTLSDQTLKRRLRLWGLSQPRPDTDALDRRLPELIRLHQHNTDEILKILRAEGVPASRFSLKRARKRLGLRLRFPRDRPVVSSLDTSKPSISSPTPASIITPVKFPFYATDLPRGRPLPTDDEITNATPISGEDTAQTIVRIGTHYVVKYGLGVNLMEGQNMLFIREKTNIPVPRVYALYSNSRGQSVIAMEYIAGQTLEAAWPLLSELEKDDILCELRGYCDTMRALPSPKYFGSVGKKKLLSTIFWTDSHNPQSSDSLINGPFDSEDDFIEGMVQKLIYNGANAVMTEYLRKICFPAVFKGHEAMFTHGDLQTKNIIVRQKLSERQAKKKLVILDWENAGWYPAYWEFCMAYAAFRWDDDWPLCVDKFLDPFPSQAASIYDLRLSLWS
ncbi:phosphotransferase enzyme family protein [Penicillium verhagenii]|uniref:phosphotransferase enzyme family protein n=1 Tax=Penicillium verhagenii TaxID=1562060 RepID=UPI0025452225|nr:phosphotransferase enzyme family protein [Penicillium verhagenii]KAJ5939169.1 phosphotransferase enzyme family protein [Penicillium verhagenii]